MEGGLRTLEFVEHLLIELLTRTQTGKLHLHVLRARQTDHTLRQVGNLHRLTHVEDEDLTAITLGTGLQHQLTGLGNQHEVTHDTLVGHRHRSTVLDLLTEQRNHRTVRTQHITETGRHKLGAHRGPAGGRNEVHLRGKVLEERGFPLLQRLVETLHIDLTDSLRTTHHIRGVHSLVGRDHHEFLHTVFHTQIGDDLRTIYIIIHGLRRVILHHRHMLIGGGMEHVVGLELTEDLLHTALVADTRHHGLRGNLRESLGHHQTNVVLRGLGLVDEHQRSGLELGHLTHDLRTDTTGRTGDQHSLVGEQLGHRLQVHTDLIARQKVLHTHRTQLHGLEVRLVVILRHIRTVQRLDILGHIDLRTSTDNRILQLLVMTEVLRTVRGHQHGLDVVLLDDLTDILTDGIHLLAHDLLVLRVLMMRDKTLHHITTWTLGLNILGQTDTALHGTID